MMTVTFGHTSPKQFAFYDPAGSCWRTWPAISLWGSERFSETWPRSGMTHDGRAFELPISEPPTAGNGSSSLLPTPAAARSGRNRSLSPGAAVRWSLDHIDRLLPTPTVNDSKAGANRTANRTNPDSKHHDGLTLTDWSRLLPTPTARDWKGANQRDDTSCLPGAVGQLLPTPQARDGENTWGADAARYKCPKSQQGRRSNLDDAIEAIRTKAPWLTSSGEPTSLPSDDGKGSPVQLPHLSTSEDD